MAGTVIIRGIYAHSRARYTVFAKGDAGQHRFLRKRSVAIVAIELVGLRIVRKQEIRPAVAIVIEHRDAERFRSRIAQARYFRDVFENAVAAVVPEPHGSALIRFGSA